MKADRAKKFNWFRQRGGYALAQAMARYIERNGGAILTDEQLDALIKQETDEMRARTVRARASRAHYEVNRMSPRNRRIMASETLADEIYDRKREGTLYAPD